MPSRINLLRFRFPVPFPLRLPRKLPKPVVVCLSARQSLPWGGIHRASRAHQVRPPSRRGGHGGFQDGIDSLAGPPVTRTGGVSKQSHARFSSTRVCDGCHASLSVLHATNLGRQMVPFFVRP